MIQEIVVFGGGAYYRDVFNAIALLAGNDALSSLIRLVMVMGLMLALIKAAFDFQIVQIFRWFIMATVIYGMVWVPKAQVHITDRFNPALVGADVANVPIGIALVASLTTRVGARVIDITETAFGDPEDVRYSRTGMIYGAKVFERLRTAQVSDPRFDQNLRGFVRGCIYYDILEGHYSAGELARQNDLWTYVTVTKGTNPGRSVEYLNASGAYDIVSCTTTAQRLNAEWAATLTDSIRLFQRRSRPELPEGQLQSAFLQEIGALHPMMLGASRDATNTFQQVLMINAIRRGVPGFSAEAGADAMGVFAETQAELQTRNTQQLLGGVAAKAIPILKIVVELLIIGIFPVVFPMFLLPEKGLTMLKGYMSGFLYLQLWGPMYVILHRIQMGDAAEKTAAAAYLPGTSPGLKLANLEAVGGVNADIAGVAGIMMMSIPVLAGTIVAVGAKAVGGQGEALLAQFRSGAEAAGGMATMGNVSMGNTAFANQSWNNMSANRMHTSIDMDMGNMRQVDSRLNRVEMNGDGSAMVVNTPISQTAVGMRHSEGISAAQVQAASERREEAKSLRWAQSEGASRARSEATEYVQQWMNGTTSTSTTGTDNRSTWGALHQQMDSTQQQLMRDYGVSETQAKQITANAALEAYGNAGVNTPLKGILPGSASAGLRAQGGISGSRSGTVNETDAIKAAQQSMSSESFSDRFDRTAAQYAAEAFTATASQSTSEALKRSDAFTTTTSITETADRMESMARSLEERADLTRSQGASMDLSYNNTFVPWAVDRLTGRQDAYGEVISQERAIDILAGRSQADIDLTQEVAREFHREMATKIDTPELLARNADVGRTVQDASFGEVRALEPTDRESLQYGLGSGSAGRPGDAFSAHAPGTREWVEERQAAEAAQAAQVSRSEREPSSSDRPAAGWAGESELQPGFQSETRDRIRGDTAAVSEALEARRIPDFEKGGGRALGEVVSDIDPRGRAASNTAGALFDPGGAHPQGHRASQNAGSRLARRYGQ